MAQQLSSTLKPAVITHFRLLLSITLMANLSTVAYLQACLQNRNSSQKLMLHCLGALWDLIEPAWKNWWMALLAMKKVVLGRISMEDFSHYLVAGIRNCRLLKCYLLPFSLSLHVSNYYFLCHILLICLFVLFCFFCYVGCAIHPQLKSMWLGQIIYKCKSHCFSLYYTSLKYPKGIALSDCCQSWSYWDGLL